MKINMKFVKNATMLLIFCTSLKGFAWGYEGHRIIVEVAMRFLKERDHNPEVQKRMMKLLNVGPDGKPTGASITPQMGASFADEMRSNPDYDVIKNLHFINVPFNVSTYEAFADKDPNGDAYTAVVALAKALAQKNPAALEGVKSLSELNKIVSLTPAIEINLLDHIYGDTSQPFHLGDGDSLGGNTIPVQVFGQVTNIHSAMDGILGYVKGGKSIEEVADDLLRTLTTKDIRDIRQKSFLQFIDETLPLRNDFLKFDRYVTLPMRVHAPTPGAPPPPPTNPQAPTTQQAGVIDYAYVEKNLPIMKRQLMISGVMLGLALEQIFTPERAKGPDVFRTNNQALSCKALF